MLSAIFIVFLFRISHQASLMSFAGFTGFLIVWQWRYQGLAGCLGLFSTLFIIQFSELQSLECFWFVGLSLSFLLTYLIAILSMEEVESVVEEKEQSLLRRSEEVSKLDGDLRQISETLSQENKKLRASLSWEKEAVKEQISLQEKEREEWTRAVAGAESTLREMEKEKAELLQSQKRASDKVTTLTEENTSLSQALKESREKAAKADQVEGLKEENTSLSLALKDAREKAEEAIQAETLKVEAESLKKELSQAQEELQKTFSQLIEKEEEIVSFQEREAARAKENKRPAVQKNTPPTPEENQKEYKGLYCQLREQFREKSEILDETRKELFQSQEEVQALLHARSEQEQFSDNECVSKLTETLHEVCAEKERLEQEVLTLEALVETLHYSQLASSNKELEAVLPGS